jgi:GntR family transcriptional regulator
MAVEVNHLATRRFPGLRKHLEKGGSLYSTLANVYGVRLAEAEETIETVLCGPHEAEILGTDVGSPMLLLARHSWDTSGNPVEYVRSVYRGDRYKFVTKLRPPAID